MQIYNFFFILHIFYINNVQKEKKLYLCNVKTATVLSPVEGYNTL